MIIINRFGDAHSSPRAIAAVTQMRRLHVTLPPVLPAHQRGR